MRVTDCCPTYVTFFGQPFAASNPRRFRSLSYFVSILIYYSFYTFFVFLVSIENRAPFSLRSSTHKREAAYLQATAARHYRPELLFPDEPAIVGRIQHIQHFSGKTTMSRGISRLKIPDTSNPWLESRRASGSKASRMLPLPGSPLFPSDSMCTPAHG